MKDQNVALNNEEWHSIHAYLIDGYNLIRQSDNLRRYERKSLEAGRNA